MSSRIKTDWRLFGAILALLAFGLIMVYSASSVVAEVKYKANLWSFASKQLLAASIGMALLLALKRIDYHRLAHPLWVFVPLGLTTLLLVGVIFVDRLAHRWYPLPGFRFQPSELAKPVLVLFLAWLVSRRELKINDRYTLLPTALVLGSLVALIGFGDLGTAAVLLAPAVVVFYVAGIERRYFYLSLTLAALLGAVFLLQKPYRLMRVTSFAGITEEKLQNDPKWRWLAIQMASTKASRDADHQPKQAKIAVGSGGLTGVGLGEGNQKLGFLPEAHTDFIFGVVCEETGLAGALFLLSLYLYIFWRGLKLYWLTPDPFGRYLALGCVSMITAQALFNMSVVLDMAPTKGIPLPLISYGGSALICTLVMLGMLMSVSDRAAD